MNVCKDRAFKLLEKISFERIAGTDKELLCAHMLEEECIKADVPVILEEFEISKPDIFEAKLEVTQPEFCSIPCIALGRSGETPDEGISAPLCYVENGSELNMLDAKGKIVLLSGALKPEVRDNMMKAGAVGFIITFGSLFDPEEMIPQLRTRNVRKHPDDPFNLPGLMIHITEAQKLLRMHPQEIRMVLKQDAKKMVKSHNVIATIKGTEKPEEIITFSAHYDSVIYSAGAWDNGTGAMTIMELMHHFKANPPKRTVKFIWCGAEEQGLLGSRAYCEIHESELSTHLLDINVDMTGVLLGYDTVICSCDESVKTYIDFLAKLEGFPIQSSIDLHSSDSSAFANAGVPAVSFSRRSCNGGAEIHSRRDVMDYLDPDTFIRTVEFMVKFSDAVINAKVFPVPRELPEELQKKLVKFRKVRGIPEKTKDDVKKKMM